MQGMTGTFLKEKFLLTEGFEKLKARLVGGGDKQNKDLHKDLPAPISSPLQSCWIANSSKQIINKAILLG
jgi:hypothetical protein